MWTVIEKLKLKKKTLWGENADNCNWIKILKKEENIIKISCLKNIICGLHDFFEDKIQLT